MSQKSDEDILNMLQTSGESEEKALRWLYAKMLPMVIPYITQHGGTQDDAKDIFQDALIVFTSHLKKGSFQRRSSIATFLLSIVRNLWNNRLRRKGYGDGYVATMKPILEQETAPAPDVPDELWMEQEKEKRVSQLLSRLGEKCREILQMRFWDGLKMEKIAERMQYKSSQIAKNKHFRCLEELRSLIQNDLQLRNDLRGLL